MNHYLIRYRPPRDNFVENSTDAENEIIMRHFQYLQELQKNNKLVLAGRTEDAEVGIAVICAESDAEAEQILENDPAVNEGVFSGNLKPFRLALGGS